MRGIADLRLYHAIADPVQLSLQTHKLAWASTAVILALGTGLILAAEPQPVAQPLNNASTQATLESAATSSDPVPPAEPLASFNPTQSSGASSKTETYTTVTINGESIEVPPNGSAQQTIINPDGSQTEVTVEKQQTTSDDGPVSNLTINSQSSGTNATTSITSHVTVSQ